MSSQYFLEHVRIDSLRTRRFLASHDLSVLTHASWLDEGRVLVFRSSTSELEYDSIVAAVANAYMDGYLLFETF